RDLPVPNGNCGGFATAKSYSLNVTVIPTDGSLQYLTLWPTGIAQPVVSTLNSLDGTIVSNAALLPAGIAGSVTALAVDRTDLVLDVNGYFAP
ncbi:MAG: hypothetical protein ABI822_34965, partial [Bryobacteraceae bacterium]